MLSYRHGFHAGNFADVVKHTVLTAILLALNKKDKPYCVLDTHAGAGIYDLDADMAQKNHEFESGITRLWPADDTSITVGMPEAVRCYLQAVQRVNPDNLSLRFYPGSPQLLRHLLRPQDRLVVCERHSTEGPRLQALFNNDRQTQVYLGDGYQGIKAYIPPKERRGLVFIDPAFERAEEIELFTSGIMNAHQRWATGIICGWFPLHQPGIENRFYKLLVASKLRNALAVEFCIEPPRERFLYGCALVVVNPPWKLEQTLQEALSWLQPRLAGEGQGRVTLRWLA